MKDKWAARQLLLTGIQKTNLLIDLVRCLSPFDYYVLSGVLDVLH